MFTKEIFGDRLKKLRLEHDEKQEDLGEALGLGKAQVSEMERGKKTTTIEKFALICEHYNVSADYMLGRTDDPSCP